MAKEQEITPKEALQILSSVQRSSRRHQRLHGDQQDKNMQQIRALEGLCGNCIHINPRVRGGFPHRSVELHCTARLSPVNLYRSTPLGEEASCDKFEQIPEIE